MRRLLLAMLALTPLLACPGGCGGGTGSDGGDAGDGGPGNHIDAGTQNELFGDTAFGINAAVVLWGSEQSDGGVTHDYVRVVLTDLSLPDACDQARRNFSDSHLTLRAHDLEFFAAGGSEIIPGAYPITVSASGAYAQSLYFNISDGNLTSPNAEILDGGAAVAEITWPTRIDAGLVSGGVVRGSFQGALSFGGTPDGSVSGHFAAFGCDLQPLPLPL